MQNTQACAGEGGLGEGEHEDAEARGREQREEPRGRRPGQRQEGRGARRLEGVRGLRSELK